MVRRSMSVSCCHDGDSVAVRRRRDRRRGVSGSRIAIESRDKAEVVGTGVHRLREGVEADCWMSMCRHHEAHGGEIRGREVFRGAGAGIGA